jgi:membrane protease YdiL (CAAX protease family)
VGDPLDVLFATLIVAAAGATMVSGLPLHMLLLVGVLALVALLSGSSHRHYRTLAVTIGGYTAGVLVAQVLVPVATRLSPALAQPGLSGLLMQGTWLLVLAWSLVPFGGRLRDMNVRLGKIGGGSLAASLAFAVAFTGWLLLTRQGQGTSPGQIGANLRLLFTTGLLFPVVGAVIEEIIFRGIILSALRAFTGAIPVSVVLQAVLYTMAGPVAPLTPQGLAVAGANLVAGLFLGWTVTRTGGLSLALLVRLVLLLIGVGLAPA